MTADRPDVSATLWRAGDGPLLVRRVEFVQNPDDRCDHREAS